MAGKFLFQFRHPHKTVHSKVLLYCLVLCPEPTIRLLIHRSQSVSSSSPLALVGLAIYLSTYICCMAVEEECRPGINPESMGVCRASCVVISRKFTLGNRGQFRCYIKLLFVCKWRTIATITCKRWVQATSHIIRYSEDPLSEDHHRHLEFMVPRSAQLLTHMRIS